MACFGKAGTFEDIELNHLLQNYLTAHLLSLCNYFRKTICTTCVWLFFTPKWQILHISLDTHILLASGLMFFHFASYLFPLSCKFLLVPITLSIYILGYSKLYFQAWGKSQHVDPEVLDVRDPFELSLLWKVFTMKRGSEKTLKKLKLFRKLKKILICLRKETLLKLKIFKLWKIFTRCLHLWNKEKT